MGDPTSRYATAGVVLRVSGALKPHHHDKVETQSVGIYIYIYIYGINSGSYPNSKFKISAEEEEISRVSAEEMEGKAKTITGLEA
jgi:hypothetical protein